MTTWRPPFRVFSGSANVALGQEIIRALDVEPGKIKLGRFNDGEIAVEIGESVRNQVSILVASTCPPHPNAALVELMLMVDAARRATAQEIWVVLPYCGYARSDALRPGVRTPVAARLVADVLEKLGVDRVAIVEPHSKQMAGFFSRPFTPLLPRRTMIEAIKQNSVILEAEREGNLVIVSPDAGGVERARAYSRKLGDRLAIVDKERTAPNQSRVGQVIGDVRGAVGMLVDDMVDTAGTICAAAGALKRAGAVAVYAMAVHPVLSDPAVQRIADSEIEQMFVSNSIPLSAAAQACPKIISVSLGSFLAQAIKRMLDGSSVSELSVGV